MGINEGYGQSLSSAIRHRMEQLNIGNKELSERSGVPLRTVNNILLGITLNPSVNIVMEMAKVLNCTIDDLLNDMADTKSAQPELSNMEKEVLETFRSMDDVDKAEALGILKGIYYSKYSSK